MPWRSAGINHEHTKDKWSQEKKGGIARLYGGIIERWWNPAESRERTEDEGTETTIPEAIVWAFLGWMERNSERLCELCASVVNNRS
ncbi:MAG: hypothetical protein STSR0001_06670 [Methanothrix sp.]